MRREQEAWKDAFPTGALPRSRGAALRQSPLSFSSSTAPHGRREQQCSTSTTRSRTSSTANLDGDQAALLIADRFHALQKLGCDTDASVVIAVHPEISILQALKLLDGGCDPRTVLRILL